MLSSCSFAILLTLFSDGSGHAEPSSIPIFLHDGLFKGRRSDSSSIELQKGGLRTHEVLHYDSFLLKSQRGEAVTQT